MKLYPDSGGLLTLCLSYKEKCVWKRRGQSILKGQSTLKGQDNRAQIVGQTNQSENRKCDDGSMTSKSLFNCEMMMNGIIQIPMKDYLERCHKFQP